MNESNERRKSERRQTERRQSDLMPAPDPLDIYALNEAILGEGCMRPVAVNDYDILYKAWHDVGADVAGISWSQFVDAIELREKRD